MSDNESNTTPKEPKTRKIKQLSQLEFMKQSCAWIGSKTLQDLELYILNKESNKFQLDTIKITPGLTKIVDEGITNAIDHYVNYPKLVKNIKITFDTKSGVISIYNDGPGITVELSKNLAGTPMYIPQMIASEFHTGDNFNEDERTTGGANGIGLKALAAYSDYLILETLDDVNKIHYTQTFKNRLELIEEPILEKVKAGIKGFTKITFLPCYSAFGISKYSPKKDGTNISKWIETRAYQAAACTTASVYYNEKLIDICNEPKNVDKIPRGFVKNTRFRQLVELFLENDESFESFILKPADDSPIKYPLEVHIAASDKKFRQHSLINGVCAYDGGNHIKHLQNQLIEGLRPQVEKIIKKTKSKFNSNLILNNVFLFVKATIPNPSWGGGNIKSKLDNDVASFVGYTFSKSDITKIWNLLETHITSQFIDKVGDKKKTKVNRGQIIIKKSDDAQYAGHKLKSHDCTLFIAEGDSALATVKEGILSKETDLTKEYYGTFNILGVPINCRKEANLIKDPKTGEYRVIRNDKLQKNERLTALVKMLGLDYEKKYGTDEEGELEFATLRYGRVCICTDADVDGCGQICGLLLNFFILFWPGLIKRGYVCRLNTPIIRAYPRNTKQYIKEFYTDKTYRTWINEEFKGDDAKADKMYDIRYYKGLGSHEKNEIPQLFKKFEKKLYIYRLDKKALDTVEIYFGKETSARKKVLSTPVSIEEPDGPEVPLSDFLNIDVKLFQRDNISRKIPHAYDGQVPSRRKVIYAARAEFANKNERMKVNAFTNITSKMTSYHHGEQSLSTTITKMAQSFIGARNLPFLYPRGQFGIRSQGGKDYASPRYIYTNLNKRLCMAMFPPVDDYLLPYVFDEGNRCEPVYYIPILPLAILENMELPATGWKVKIWAREIWAVIEQVEKLINGEQKKCDALPIWNNSPGCEIRKYKSKQYAFGKYIYDAKTHNLTVTALPLGVFSCQIAGSDEENGGMREEFRAKPCDETSDSEVKITFYFKPDAVKDIKKTYGNSDIDCFEDYLNLKNSLDENINMIDGDGKIIEYKTYNDVVDDWFKARASLYAERIDREIILTNLRILYLQNVIRFIKNHLKYEINPKKKRIDVDKILSKAEYDTFNKALLFSPKYTKAAELRHLIVNNIAAGTSYDYLVNLRYSDLLEEACIEKEEELKKEMEKLKDLEDDLGDEKKHQLKGGKTWIRELNELKDVIKLGLEKGWDYGKKVAKFKD